jgi:hypothetical protein
MTIALLALLIPLAGSAAGVSGVVLDPQDLPIRGAMVSLTCDGRDHAAHTDASGRFTFNVVVPGEGCRLAVATSGFEPALQLLSPEASRSLTLRLRLADIQESVAVVGAARRPSFLSVDLSEDDFRHLANNTADLINEAKLLAGATTRPSVVYVDGLPSTTLPPMAMVARISVNGDPFSAEYADGDVATIHIITKAPARTFRIQSGTDAVGFGGRDFLSSQARSDSTSGHFGFAGPVPRLPLTFSASVYAGRDSTVAPVLATLPAAMAPAPPDDVPTVNEHVSGSIELHYAPSIANRVRVSYRDAHRGGSNLGVGGLALPEAGYASASRSREFRGTLSRTSSGFVYEAGVIASVNRSQRDANADSLGISVAGAFAMGGDALTSSDSRKLQWTLKQVVRSNSVRPWSAGLILSGADHFAHDTANRAGSMQFDTLDAYEAALRGEPTGTLVVTRGDGTVAYSPFTAAPFVQKTLLRTDRFEANGGVRADYHSRFGTLISPRLSVAGRVAGFNLGAGAGLFARNVPDFVVLRSIRNDGVHFQDFLATNVALDARDHSPFVRERALISRLDPELARPREIMQRLSIERPFGRFVPAFEYTWSRETHMLGADRRLEGDSWIDTVRSDRLATRHRAHAQARYSRGQLRVSADYEWIRSRDNTDGPFSFPERPGDTGAEWAPSAGVAPHNVTVAASFTLPGRISVNVSDAWNSASPYNITTGFDAAGNGLFVDRGGRPRNSGIGPSMNALSLYAYRRVAIPRALVRLRQRWHVNIGVRGSNLLNQANFMSVGSVASAASFGRPLSAFPGRSIRLFLTLD